MLGAPAHPFLPKGGEGGHVPTPSLPKGAGVGKPLFCAPAWAHRSGDIDVGTSGTLVGGHWCGDIDVRIPAWGHWCGDIGVGTSV